MVWAATTSVGLFASRTELQRSRQWARSVATSPSAVPLQMSRYLQRDFAVLLRTGNLRMTARTLQPAVIVGAIVNAPLHAGHEDDNAKEPEIWVSRSWLPRLSRR
jgi:hypothetical protein